MRVTYHPEKRRRTLRERRLDFEDAKFVFAGVTVEVEDARKDYGEASNHLLRLSRGSPGGVGYTPRGAARHVFSMRKANAREQARIASLLEV